MLRESELRVATMRKLKRFPIEEIIFQTPKEAMGYYRMGGLYTVPKEVYEQLQVKVELLEEQLEKYERKINHE